MRGFKGLKPKKKEKKFVDLHLEKDGESQVFHMETSSLWQMTKAVKKLSGMNRKGWKLMYVTGNDSEKVEMFNKVAQGYMPSAKEALEFGGLKHMPKQIKGFFKKEEGSDETDGEPEAEKQ